jgi:hypothetical protein
MHNATLKTALGALGVVGLAIGHTASATVIQASTGNGSVILAVVDSAGDSFYYDTGDTISNFLPGNSTSINVNLSGSANYQSLLTAAAGGQLQFAVIGGANETLGNPTPNGNVTAYVTTTNQTTLLLGVPNANVRNWQLIDGNFIQVLNSGNVEASDNTFFVNGGTGATSGLPQFVATGQDVWYGNTGTFTGTLANAGTNNNFYFVTGTVVTGGRSTDTLLGTFSFNNGQFTFNNANTPVPLPAPVWLFGSGLLGLIGLGRRRAA